MTESQERFVAGRAGFHGSLRPGDHAMECELGEDLARLRDLIGRYPDEAERMLCEVREEPGGEGVGRGAAARCETPLFSAAPSCP